MITLHDAVYAAYPNTGVVRGSDIESLEVLDRNHEPMEIDATVIIAKFTELEAEEIAKQEAQANAKQAALAKLMALGLTEEEALALGK
jgi:hypothetical protein